MKSKTGRGAIRGRLVEILRRLIAAKKS